ncbi:type II toxin-antitoxin system HigB family toxin [Pseudoflavitalea sp. X16]|uniref:type II toxin-antitoxin system HigB family toxin n=1 Tax=Paraflavitalea devenefica TaxID=2716334 RepID=UPI001423C48D|nr:type II toxin-antitoxin system HigB family toxin [Paraflavitalea devenefica]NII28191.1 type II toxin-antitoxin system HigB family toxin [Paraflavitalea devenefica]
MVVISYRTIREFSDRHNDSADALNNWYRIIEKADFGNFNELRSIFNSCDAVGNDRYVFNIKGNNYRLIALIQFNVRTVYILFVGTHAEYDKISAPTIKFKK